MNKSASTIGSTVNAKQVETFSLVLPVFMRLRLIILQLKLRTLSSKAMYTETHGQEKL